MKKKGNRKRKETYLFYWPHLFTTSNNLQVRNICTRMTNGNENENRFLGERSYFFSIEVLFVISKEEYITNYNTGSLIHPISLCSTKPFPFSIYWISSDRLFVLQLFLSLLSNISWVVDIKIRLLYCENFKISKYCIFNSFCLCDGPSVKNLMSQKVTTLFVNAVRNAVQIYSI